MKHLKTLLTAGFLLFSVTQSWAIPLTVGSSPQLFQFTGGMAQDWVTEKSRKPAVSNIFKCFMKLLSVTIDLEIPVDILILN